jgi:hypothetical protein
VGCNERQPEALVENLLGERQLLAGLMPDRLHPAKLGLQLGEPLFGPLLGAIDPLALGAAQLSGQPLGLFTLSVHAAEKLAFPIDPLL